MEAIIVALTDSTVLKFLEWLLYGLGIELLRRLKKLKGDPVVILI